MKHLKFVSLICLVAVALAAVTRFWAGIGPAGLPAAVRAAGFSEAISAPRLGVSVWVARSAVGGVPPPMLARIIPAPATSAVAGQQLRSSGRGRPQPAEMSRGQARDATLPYRSDFPISRTWGDGRGTGGRRSAAAGPARCQEPSRNLRNWVREPVPRRKGGRRGSDRDLRTVATGGASAQCPSGENWESSAAGKGCRRPAS